MTSRAVEGRGPCPCNLCSLSRKRQEWCYDGNNFSLDDFLCSATDDRGWCPCGLCSFTWKEYGWRCDEQSIAYLPSGGVVDLGPGCRSQIALKLNVPPGFIGRCGMTLHVGRCPGIAFVSSMELGGLVRPKDIYIQKKIVPVLPMEYYSRMILDLMLRKLFIGADGSAFSLHGSRAFPVVYHVREMRLGTVYYMYKSFRLEFSSGYRSSSFFLDVQLPYHRRLWLSHEVISVNRRSRCVSGIVHIQSRFRRRKAANVMSQGQ